MKEIVRCPWCEKSESERHYHDTEWGVPLFEDGMLFEFLVLDTFQAGLSWKIVLDKREHFRKAFFNFQPEELVQKGPAAYEDWLGNPGLVRNRLKLKGLIANAAAFLKVQSEWGSFSNYVWSFVGGAPVQNAWEEHPQIPSQSPQALAMSKDMKKRGFTFCGPTICYAFMQAAGLVQDHLVGCFRYEEIRNGSVRTG
jgi:DNA-3-methyladenine glycosylase I